MKKTVLRLFTIAGILFVASCSKNDDIASTNLTSVQITGKWIIEKAIYDSSSDTIYYSINGQCGKEILEFNSNKLVTETIYIDENCNNGATTEFDWWNVDASHFRFGYTNSDTYKDLYINENKLYFDGWNDWGVRKYYIKLN